MIVDHLPILPVVLPLLAAPFCIILKNRILCWGLGSIVSLSCLLISLFIITSLVPGNPLIYSIGGWESPVGISYFIDHLNGVLLFFVCMLTSFLILFFSFSLDWDISKKNQYFFYTAFLLCFAGLVGVILTADAFNAFVFIEISSLATYILVALGRDKQSLLASYRYLIFGTIGATFFVLGIGVLYILTGTLNFQDMAVRLSENNQVEAQYAAFTLVMVGLFIKASVFPLHAWLPNSYAHAPALATTFFSAIGTKVFLYLIIRFAFDVFNFGSIIESTFINTVFFILAILGIFFGAMAAFFEKNIKKLFAYSSVSQVGLILIGISLGTVDGLVAGIIHLVNHGITKGFIFVIICYLTFKIGRSTIDDFSGIAKAYPISCAGIVLGCLSLIGVPGTPGFITKFSLISSMIPAQNYILAFTVLLLSILSVLYSWRLVEVLYFGNLKQNVTDCEKWSNLNKKYFALLIIFCIFMFVLAFDTSFTIDFARIAAEQLVN